MPALEAAGPRRMVRCLHREEHAETAEVNV
jgi:peptide/nickel transport system ATP-binding protein